MELLADEILNRQVCEEEMGAERINTPAFVPTASQHWLLSTLRGRVHPLDALTRYNEAAAVLDIRSSVGTWPISVAHVRAIASRAFDDEGFVEYDDGLVDRNPVDHASVDFRGLGRTPRERLGKLLRNAAMKTGYLYLRADLLPRYAWAVPAGPTI